MLNYASMYSILYCCGMQNHQGVGVLICWLTILLQIIEGLVPGYVQYAALSARLEEVLQATRPLEVHQKQNQNQVSTHALRMLSSKENSGCQPTSGKTIEAAVAMIAHDCRRVGLFYESQHHQLWMSLLNTIIQMKKDVESFVEKIYTNNVEERRLEAKSFFGSLKAELDHLGSKAAELEAFTQQNTDLVGSLLMKADGRVAKFGYGGGPTESWQVYRKVAEDYLFGALRLDPIYLGLSDAYEYLQQARDDYLSEKLSTRQSAGGQSNSTNDKKKDRWVAPQRFVRVTRKFWLRQRDVGRFKAEVLRHLPILIYGERCRLTDVEISELRFLTPPPTRDSSAVSSVYYDTLPELPVYHSRLRRVDGAASIRLRWYGPRDVNNPSQQMFVERKTHREPVSNELSVKERAAICQGELPSFVKGETFKGCSEEPSDRSFLDSVQSQLVEAKQVPVIRTTYNRTAFQLSSNNLVRLSLDTELAMIREKVETEDGGGLWCRQDLNDDLNGRPSLVVPQQDIVRFPYAIVEVKLQRKPPEWLKSLVRSGLLLPAPRFSKFLHGTASLYQDCADTLPHWFLPDDDDPDWFTPASWEEMADTSDPWVHDAAEWLFPSGFDLSTAPPNKVTTPPEGQQGQQGQRGEQQGSLPLDPGPPPRERPFRLFGHAGHLGWGKVTSTHNQHSSNEEEPMRIGTNSLADKSNGEAHQTLNCTSFLGLESIIVHHNTPSGGGDSSSHHSPQTHHEAKELNLSSTRTSSERMEGNSTHGRSTPVHDDDLVGRKSKPDLSAGSPLSLVNQSTKPNESQSRDLELGLGLPQEDPVPLKSIRRAKALVKTRVEPKTFFANERTFLAWLNISVLVMFLALSLLSGSSLIPNSGGMSSSSSSSAPPSVNGTSNQTPQTRGCAPGDPRCFAAKLSGALIAPVALAFMAYALFMYKKRTIQILRRETVRYDDQRGPVVLVAILLVVMVISYVLALVYYF